MEHENCPFNRNAIDDDLHPTVHHAQFVFVGGNLFEGRYAAEFRHPRLAFSEQLVEAHRPIFAESDVLKLFCPVRIPHSLGTLHHLGRRRTSKILCMK